MILKTNDLEALKLYSPLNRFRGISTIEEKARYNDASGFFNLVPKQSKNSLKGQISFLCGDYCTFVYVPGTKLAGL